MKVFISQLMRDRENDDILAERQEIADRIEDLMKKAGIDEELEVVDSFEPGFCEGRHPIYCIGQAISKIPQADFVYFGPDFSDGRGTRIEASVVEEYAFPAIYWYDPEEAVLGELRDIYLRKESKNNA